MKNNRGGFLLIFIGISVIIHLLFLLSTGIETSEPAVLQQEYIPVSLNTRKQPLPEAMENTVNETIPPDAAEATPEPAPEPDPVPEPAPEAAPEPAPEAVAAPPETAPPAGPATPEAERSSSAPAETPDPAPAPQSNPFDALMRSVNELKDSVYPLKAKKRKYQGTVVVELKLDPDGNLTAAEIVQNCRYPILDDAAMHLIELVFEQPYPHHMGRDVILKMPITFRLL